MTFYIYVYWIVYIVYRYIYMQCSATHTCMIQIIKLTINITTHTLPMHKVCTEKKIYCSTVAPAAPLPHARTPHQQKLPLRIVSAKKKKPVNRAGPAGYKKSGSAFFAASPRFGRIDRPVEQPPRRFFSSGFYLGGGASRDRCEREIYALRFSCHGFLHMWLSWGMWMKLHEIFSTWDKPALKKMIPLNEIAWDFPHMGYNLYWERWTPCRIDANNFEAL